jgi:hypothetical protein
LEGENSEKGLKIGLNLPQFVEETSDSPVISPDFPIISTTLEEKSAIIEEKKEEKVIIEPIVEEIRQSPVIRAKLFTESPAFPDISEFMQGKEAETDNLEVIAGNTEDKESTIEPFGRDIEEIKAVEEERSVFPADSDHVPLQDSYYSPPIKAESPILHSEEPMKTAISVNSPPSPPSSRQDLPAVFPAATHAIPPTLPLSPDLNIVEPLNLPPPAKPDASVQKPDLHSHIPMFEPLDSALLSFKASDPLLIPFPSVVDAEAFFSQAPSKPSRKPNPFAF